MLKAPVRYCQIFSPDLFPGRQTHWPPWGNSVKRGSGWIQLWDTATGKLPPSFERKSPPISRAVLSPNGKITVTWGERGPPRVWETRTGKDLGPLLDEKMNVYFVVFSPDGKELVTHVRVPE